MYCRELKQNKMLQFIINNVKISNVTICKNCLNFYCKIKSADFNRIINKQKRGNLKMVTKVKRKYLSEFALHVYSSHGTMFYPADIPILSFKEKYHIYMINLIPKLNFVMESLQQFNDYLSIDIKLTTASEIRTETIEFAVDDIDHTQLLIETDKPKKTLNIFYSKDRESGIGLRVLYAYIQFADTPLDTEVLYIGQSYGTGGSRTALDRLGSHSTLQKILSEMSFSEEIRDISLSLWEFTPRLFASFDGISKKYEKNKDEDTAHMKQILREEQQYNQIINITEAALINYFKPVYNDKFKNNFPLITHNGYKYYYDLDYNSVLVEIDQETINGKVYSPYRSYTWFHDIKYGLHPENIRKSMFDIFTDPE
jgi:hypothetical protein